MKQIILPIDVEKDNSSAIYQPPARLQIRPYRMGKVYGEADAGIEVAFPFPLPSLLPLEVKGQIFSVLAISQMDGSIVTRTSTSRFNATGQGKTEEEALQDIKSAIELLMEEEANPSGDVPWPENFQ